MKSIRIAMLAALTALWLATATTVSTAEDLEEDGVAHSDLGLSVTHEPLAGDRLLFTIDIVNHGPDPVPEYNEPAGGFYAEFYIELGDNHLISIAPPKQAKGASDPIVCNVHAYAIDCGPIGLDVGQTQEFRLTTADDIPYAEFSVGIGSKYEVDRNSANDSVTYKGGGKEPPPKSKCKNEIAGSDGDDRLSGGTGSDRIEAEGGDDVLDGAGGVDCLAGGGGRDWLKGGPGKDSIDGGEEADLLDGKGDADRVTGGAGDDFVSGGAAADLLRGGAGDDILSDGLGRNEFRGEAGDDVISARQSSPEKVDCGPGHDIAYVDARDRTQGCEQVLRTGAPDFAWPDNLAGSEGSRAAKAPAEQDLRTLQGGPGSFARAWAPLVYLAPNEGYLPEVANDYIHKASLKWAHSFCRDTLAKRAGSIDPAKLSAAKWHPSENDWSKTPYYQRKRDRTCLGHAGRAYSTAEYTRPHDDNVLGRGWGRRGEGFYLDLPDTRTARGGRLPQNDPVYYECCFRTADEGWAITYWFFYAYDDKPVAGGLTSQRHEADWERISIRFDRDLTPRWVAFFAHDAKKGYDPRNPADIRYPGYLQCPWEDIETYQGHPVVYSARGSHASYPAVDDEWHLTGIADWFADDQTGRGIPWETWDSISNARSQAWWGYGGGWGQNADIPFDSGPLGPSPWKFPFPTAWVSRTPNPGASCE